jgi:hypothetical protein
MFNIDRNIDFLIDGKISARNLLFLYLNEGRDVKLTDKVWISLIAHFLDLNRLSGVDPDTGKVVDPAALKKSIKALPASGVDPDTGEVTAETFAKLRGIAPETFKLALTKYKDRAEKYRKIAEFKRIMRGVLIPKAEFTHQRFKSGRRLDPKIVLNRIKLAADYLNAHDKDPSLTLSKFASSKGVTQTFVTTSIAKHRAEAEAYRGLLRSGEEVGAPQERIPVSKKERKEHKEQKEKFWKPIILELGKQIVDAQTNGVEPSIAIKVFSKSDLAKESKVDNPDILLKAWRKYKEKWRNDIAIYTGHESKRIKKIQNKPILQRQAKVKRTSLENAWQDLALDVEKHGLTPAIILRYSDLVGVHTIKKVKKFPKQWKDGDILKWMSSNADTYVSLAKPKLEAELKEMGLWNPPSSAKDKARITGSSSSIDKSKEVKAQLTGWHKETKPKVLIIGGVKSRTLTAHPWLYKYFNVSYVESGRTSGRAATSQIHDAVSSGNADLIIVMSGFIGHSEYNVALDAASKLSIVVTRLGTKPIKSILHAAFALKQSGKAPWFVNAYELEKGKLHEDLMDWNIYTLLESVNLEYLLV